MIFDVCNFMMTPGPFEYFSEKCICCIFSATKQGYPGIGSPAGLPVCPIQSQPLYFHAITNQILQFYFGDKFIVYLRLKIEFLIGYHCKGCVRTF